MAGQLSYTQPTRVRFPQLRSGFPGLGRDTGPDPAACFKGPGNRRFRPCGVMDNISAFQADAPGSIPGTGSGGFSRRGFPAASQDMYTDPGSGPAIKDLVSRQAPKRADWKMRDQTRRRENDVPSDLHTVQKERRAVRVLPGTLFAMPVSSKQIMLLTEWIRNSSSVRIPISAGRCRFPDRGGGFFIHFPDLSCKNLRFPHCCPGSAWKPSIVSCT